MEKGLERKARDEEGYGKRWKNIRMFIDLHPAIL